MKIRIIESDEMEMWDKFVFTHKLGSLYHTSLWRELIESVYGHQPLYLIIEDGKGDITAGLPLFLVHDKITGNRLSSVPGAHFCNPLVSTQEMYDRLINFVLDFKEKNNVKYLELKTSSAFPFDNRKFGKAMYGYSTYILNIDPSLETIHSSFHNSCVQRAIKKSYKSNIELAVAESVQEVQDFYQLYLKMRKDAGLLPQPYKFFSSMWKIMSPKQHIDILHAKHADSIISTILLLKYKNTVIYEYGASIPEMLSLRPSHFLLWESIKRSKLQGYKEFDFGRTADEDTGLSDFKRRWGTEKESLPYYYIPNVSGFASIRRWSLSRNIMHYSIKHMPDSCCSFMGKVLYKKLV